MASQERVAKAVNASRWPVLIVATLLLVSYGGAIFAAPLTLPVLFLAATGNLSKGFRVAAAVVLMLTTAEAMWALAYLTAGEASPMIWLLPLVAAIGAGALLLASIRRLAQHHY